MSDTPMTDAAVKNVLVLIQGTVMRRDTLNPHLGHAELLDNLALKGVRRSDFDAIIAVEWGKEPKSAKATPLTELREDLRLTRAEATLHKRVSISTGKDRATMQNRLLSAFHEGLVPQATRLVTDKIKDEVLIYGITDAIYYASPDGETAIRSTVYHQVLNGLDVFTEASEVRIFLVAHSLGVTVAHDFLFGLFAPHHSPDFAASEDIPEATRPDILRDGNEYRTDKRRFAFWRAAAQRSRERHNDPEDSGPRLSVGGLITTGGHLPLMLLRTQEMVDRLAAEETLDPTLLGLPREGKPVWYNFYDVDDVMGFPCHRLYDVPTIVDIQVNTGLLEKAHSRYWTSNLVIDRIADLIRANLSQIPPA